MPAVISIALVLIAMLHAGLQANAAPVTGERIAAADKEPGQWLSHGRDYGEQRFSPLKTINVDTVKDLGLTWKYETGNHRGMEATPLVIDGVMYLTTAWSRVAALDARTGKELWRYDPKVDGAKGRDACCDVVNRGLAAWGDKLYLGALDGRLIALNMKDGSEAWSVQTTDTSKPYTITGAPRVVKGKVVIGNGGAEFGVRGYFSAYDAETGEMAWRFYTVPDAPGESVDSAAMILARKTWAPDSLWETGLGGTVWDSFAYDPQLNLLYVGVGNASQYNREVRSPGGGDNLFVSSILAVNPDNGELVWHYQTTPADAWDYTATQHMILADISILGQKRKVLMQAPKNGFFYVLDRTNGELISAEKYVFANWASHVDPETGRPVETGLGDWADQSRMVSPAVFGGHNWHPMSFSPQTELVYIPTLHQVYPFQADKNYEYDIRTTNTGEDYAAVAKFAPSVRVNFCSPTRLTAWNPVTQKQAWQVGFNRGVSAGLLSTAGSLVFQGTTGGDLVAYRDANGEELWRQSVNVGIMAPPISYELDGEQYIAVVAGIGGALGGHTDVLDNINTGHVFAFKLGGKEPAPVVASVEKQVQVDASQMDEALVERGLELYAQHCIRCHGVGVRSSGLYPDLRLSSAAIHQSWEAILLEGALAPNGMASFSDVLSKEDVNAIHSYVISTALESTSFGNRMLQRAADMVCIPADWLAD
ncbi:MAG: PQQ-dependent dehydrogenase, methanol/ethanol family [Pseudomonadales bacterium]|nr:PQQ-dependent dehydrogenase, methanol/ethanol family [Pseudomonadales bacterium]